MKLQVTHRTRYAYAAPVRDSFNEVHLQPADTTRQRRLAFRLSVQPTTRLASRLDFYLNTVHTFEVAAPHAELVVEAHSEVETCDTPTLDATATPRPLAALGDCARFAAALADLLANPERRAAMSAAARAWARERFDPERQVGAYLALFERLRPRA